MTFSAGNLKPLIIRPLLSSLPSGGSGDGGDQAAWQASPIKRSLSIMKHHFAASHCRLTTVRTPKQWRKLMTGWGWWRGSVAIEANFRWLARCWSIYMCIDQWQGSPWWSPGRKRGLSEDPSSLNREQNRKTRDRICINYIVPLI